MTEERFEGISHEFLPLSGLIEIIKNTPEAIKAEMARAPQTTWLSCFNNAVAALRLELDAILGDETISQENYDKAASEIEALTTRVTGLIRQDPKGEAAEEIKTELMVGLENIGKHFN